MKETRRIVLDDGANRVALRDVSARMRPETAQLRSLSHPGTVSLLEQNFDFDLLTPATLLEKYVGRNVTLVRTHPTTGAESTETAQVLAAGQGVVLKVGDRIETGVPGRHRLRRRAAEPARPAHAGDGNSPAGAPARRTWNCRT